MKKKAFIVKLTIFFCLSFLSIKAQENFESRKVSDNSKENSRPKYEVQFNFANETLSRNYGFLRSAGIYMEYKGSDLRTVWASYRVVRRNSLRDQEVTAGIYKSLGKRRALTLEASFSPTAQAIGRFSVTGEVEKAFKNGFVPHLGARYTSYKTAKATAIFGTAEKYWGNNRAAYTLNLTKVTGSKFAPTHRVQYSRYYGERLNTFGVGFSVGRDYEYLGQAQGMLRNQTWSISGSFKHWLTKKIAVNADVSLHRQGNLYYRKGINIGLRYRF